MKPSVAIAVGLAVVISATAGVATAQIPGPSVNMVSGTTLPDGDPFLQRQNEPSLAVSSRNPCHLLAGSNDYRTVDLPGVTDDEEARDAWLGVYKSYDCGFRWKTTLVPGYRQDPQGASSPLYGLAAGADPTVRAGTNGLFYYLGIAFDRGSNGMSKVFVARYVDLNQETGDSIKYLNTTVVDSGTAGQFIDKPSLGVDIPRAGAKTCSVEGQTFPGGNVYAVYSSFVGQIKNNVARLYVTRSTDCGATWDKPTKISEGTRTNQGATIAIDPSNGAVYIAWRQFSLGSSQPDAILIAKSTDGGKTFSKSSLVATFSPFDQKTGGAQFRTNAFPAMAVDGSGRVYVAWSARGFAPLRSSPISGDARIVMSTSANATTWSMPRAVDNAPMLGHQFMPALTFAAGRLQVIYYDLREDATYGQYTIAPDGHVVEERLAAGDLLSGHPEKVFWDWIADTTPAALLALGPLQRRHTLDVRSAQAAPDANPQFTTALVTSQRISNYRVGGDTLNTLLQLEFNPPNLPLYAQGTVPFIGDYIDVAAQAIVPDGSGWRFNTAANKPAIFHAVWTDNRDVHPPALGHSWSEYTPPNSPYTSQACVAGTTGMRNANIYTSRITPGLTLSTPGNAKPLDAVLPRAFAVVVQNTTLVTRSYRLTLPAPGTVTASFLQFPSPPLPDPLLSLDVSIPALSSAARTVYVRSADPHAETDVLVQEVTAPGGSLVPLGAVDTLTLNPDATNPAITNPAITNETFNPAITNPAITNPAITNPAITNPAITNPAITNPAITNPAITNPAITNPAITNDEVSDPAITNPAITNTDIQNGVIMDVTWTVTNTGNTAAAYSTKLVLNRPLPAGFKKQLILHKTYVTPAVGANCALGEQNGDVLVANILNPTFTDLSGIPTSTVTDPAITNATLALAPGEAGKITLRIVDTDRSNNVTITDPVTGKPVSVDPAFNPTTDVVTGVVADAVNSTEAAAGSTQPPVAVAGTSGGTFLSAPFMGIVNVPITPTVAVQVRDNQGAVVPGATVTQSLSTNPTGASLLGNTAVADAVGIAQFPTLRVNRVGLGFVMQAASGPAVLGQTSPFNILEACAALGVVPVDVYSLAALGTQPLLARAGANFNNDGRPDVAVLSANGLVTRMINNGAGGLQFSDGHLPGVGFTTPADLALGDFDEDGLTDTIVAFTGSNNLGLMISTPSGVPNPTTAIPVPASPNAVAVADFDGDGHLDLAVVSTSADAVYFLFGDGTGHFGAAVPHSTGAGSGPSSIAVGDLNEDGYPDVAVATSDAGTVAVFLGAADRSIGSLGPYAMGGSLASIALHDMDGDHHLDLVLADTTLPEKAVVAHGNGDGSFASPASFALGGTPSSIAVGDFDSDGRMDIAAAIPTANHVTVLFGNGGLTFRAPVNMLASAAPTGVAAFDLDGDGRDDLIVTDNGTVSPTFDNVKVVPGACGAITANLQVSLNSAPASAGTGFTVQHTATVTNLGPFPAHNVVLKETFSAGTLVGVNPTAGVCFGIAPVTCNIGTLAAGATATVVYTFQMPATSIVAKVVATADETDLSPGNNSAQAATGWLSPLTFNVTNPNDSGPGSLRQAILDANAHGPVKDTIAFGFFSGGPIVPLTPLPAITDPVLIDGTTVPGPLLLNRVEVNGAGQTGAGFNVTTTAGGSTIRGLSITGWASHGIHLAGGNNVVSGNYIGLRPAGNVSANGEGIWIDASANNVIGGTTAADRNVISGNNGHGILINGGVAATNNAVYGNYIGLDVAGTGAMANGGSGVRIEDPAFNNLVGGPAAGQRNVISGNGQNGVETAGSGVGDGNTISGNYIGTAANGQGGPIGNASAGVFASGRNTIVGGLTAADRNIITGNQYGVMLFHTTSAGTKIMGNTIGLTLNPVISSFGNTSHGVWVINGPNDTLIGISGGFGRGNVISGNGGDGIRIESGASGTVIGGNAIGSDAGGDLTYANFGYGVHVVQGTDNVIGLPAPPNIVKYNQLGGVRVDASAFANARNAIRGNNISFQAAGLGIDLGTAGQDLNDAQDPDTGANELQNYPIVTGAVVSASLQVDYSFNSTPNASFILDFYASDSGQCLIGLGGKTQGERHLGSVPVTTDGSGNIAPGSSSTFAAVLPGTYITMTATDAQGNTSEFSPCVVVTTPAPAPLTVATAGMSPYAPAEDRGERTGRNRRD